MTMNGDGGAQRKWPRGTHVTHVPSVTPIRTRSHEMSCYTSALDGSGIAAITTPSSPDQNRSDALAMVNCRD